MLAFVKKHRIFFVSAVFCLLSLHIATTSRVGAGGAVVVGRVLSYVSSPVKRAASGVRSAVSDVWHGYFSLVGTEKENTELKKTVSALIEENVKLREEASLNARLKELLTFKESYKPKTAVAGVLSVSNSKTSGSWARTMVIDKGIDAMLIPGMAVITPRGTVGRIVESHDRASRVLLVTDTRSTVDVVIQRTRVRALVEGDGDTGLLVKYVSHLDDVAPGDKLVTSGISPLFPPGIAVGEVTKVERGDDSLFRYIEATPSVDFRRVEEVAVVTEEPMAAEYVETKTDAKTKKQGKAAGKQK